MKLLDPLNGLKFSQMHFFVHIAFFAVMFLVDKEHQFDKNKKPDGSHSLSMMAEQWN